MQNNSALLPIDEVMEDLLLNLSMHNRCLLVAPPGAGKTTRVPLALLEQEWTQGGKILLLEPRRVAARHAAGFMAASLGQDVGAEVGYRVRLDSRISQHTRIEVVTQGILTRMIQDDPLLEGISAIIFDEFHERALDADLGLALALDIQNNLREDLRILLMSATLECGPLLELLGTSTPVIHSAGRQYPVTTEYHPPASAQVSLESHLASLVVRASHQHDGDILVFLPGIAEIRRLENELASRQLPLRILSLHGQLSLEQQQSALRPDPEGYRKVVLSTSLAESSLTIDGVRIVIDCGLMRVPQFYPRTGMTRLETKRVSQASADQRRGRAGRQGPGLCLRAWAEHQPLQAFTEPEMLQADLSPLALELALWGIQDSNALPWLTPPPTATLAQARQLLSDLGALKPDCQPTALGKSLAALGCHPRLAVMILKAAVLGKAEQMAAVWLAAMLQERDSLDASSDLGERLEQLLSQRRGPLYRRLEAQSRSWCRGLRLPTEQTPRLDCLGLLLTYAYPDRVAQRRGTGQFQLVSGQQAWLAEHDSLAHQDWLVVADLDGKIRQARIFKAVTISLGELQLRFPEAFDWQQRAQWNDETERLEAFQEQRLGNLILARKPANSLADELKVPALLEAIRQRGLSGLQLDDNASQLLARLGHLRSKHSHWPGTQHVIPDMSEEALLANLDNWLAPYLQGMNSLSEVRKINVYEALLNQLDWPQRQMLDTLLPTSLTVPSGSQVSIDYIAEIPVLAVRLQEMFGQLDTPAVLQGTLPLLIHLLSPARRPIQITRDMRNFWQSTYHEVRKDLKGRYPKHYWPEDPFSAEAIRGVRPR
ncbi:hypothetical protein WH50_21545 [Pokkaliibacter plantistimulans]|uniref:ATP-dependent helicase n=1 Tax=Pokkaliibacter plantistimulans TaxID=1635171 RepID=A0ABX5LRT0_9GAMM|nr:ATP-dependent helicase HrpB [Pokkaliibacter plantistimulans]PXF29349.1 hypothetical protein WH50_21545 [Pokkaliibacter plantistimulans]